MDSIKGYAFNKEISKTKTEYIYEAADINSKKKVIISILNIADLTASEKIILENQSEIFKESDEESILRVIDIIKESSSLAIITEYFSEGNFNNYIESETMEINTVLELAIQLVEIIEKIHDSGIILRSLTPESFSIDLNNRIKLVNIEISNNIKYDIQNINSPEIIKNYLPYISPEQTGRINQIVDYRSNHYSIGIIIFKLLTGSVPFLHEDALEMFHAHIAVKPVIIEKNNSPVFNYLSKVILKLLSKNPNDRYVNLNSLKDDLNYLLKASNNLEKFFQFTPGYNDILRKFVLSQKFFGREKELDVIAKSFDRVGSGKVELILITGDAGIGKSKLVLEAHKDFINQGGSFFSGKFNLTKKNEPYIAIIEIFTSFIKRILIEKKNYDDLIIQFNQAIGINGKIVSDIIPEIKLIFGEQPEIQQVGVDESYNRFKNIFENFFYIIQKNYQPIVFFIDDLQWADDASLNLLQILINSNLNNSIQFILSYRDESEERVGYLEKWLSEIESYINIRLIKVTPFSENDLKKFFPETIKSEESDIDDLSSVVFEKTAGNPFFIEQFLEMLFSDNYLKFNKKRKIWEWDIEEIQTIDVTENVADIIIEKIKTLPVETFKILQFSSIIGSKFDIHTLSKTINRSAYELFIILKSLVSRTILSLHKEEYFFLHDRIYEAVYSTIPDDDKIKFHYKIGIFLISEMDENKGDFFRAADHLNLGIDLISKNSLKEKLLDLNHIAGKKAMRSNANLSALNYFNYCLKLFPENLWETNYNLTYSIFTEIAQCHYHNGDFVKADEYFNLILENVKSDLERAKIYSLQILLLTNKNKYKEAVFLGIKALSLFKIKISKAPSKLTVLKEFLKNKNFLKKIGIENILNLPDLDDPVKLAITDILSNMLQPAYFSPEKKHRDLMIVCIFKLMNFSLKYGNTLYSPYAYVSYGAVLCSKFYDYKNAYEIGEAGILLNDKNKNPKIFSKVYVIFSGMINFWNNSAERSLEYLMIAVKSGIDNGDLLFMGNALTQYIYHSIRMGKNLNDIIDTYFLYEKILIGSKHDEAINTIQSFYHMMLVLKGETFNNNSYTDENFNEEIFGDKIKDKTRLYYNFILTKLESLYFFDYYREALEYGNKIYKDIENVFVSVITTTEYYFYYFLTITTQFESFSKREKKLYHSRLKKIEKKFRLWAEQCEENFSQQHLLIKAELSRINNKTGDVINYFNLALTAAKKNNYKNHEAIIAECFGRFYLTNNDNISAAAFINLALVKYKSWGADGKVKSIQGKYSAFIKNNILPAFNETDTFIDLDIKAILKVADTISSELHLDKLLRNLLKILFENAGAERCIVILPDEKNLFIEAEGYIDDRETSLLKSISIEAFVNIPLTIIKYVENTKEIVVLDNAANSKSFSIDPYIRSNSILSIFCLPIIKQQEIMGIIYMDNSLMEGVFSHERVELLKTLSSYIATSLENSILFNKAKKSEVKLLRQYEEMESQCEEMEVLNEELQKTQISLIDANKDLEIFKMFAETSTQGIGMANADGEQTYINKAMCEMIGHGKPEDVYGVNIKEYHPPEILEKMENEIIPIVLEKGQWTGESILLSKTGKKIPIIQNMFLIRNKSENLDQFATIMTDITENKKNEETFLKVSKLESLGIFAGGIAHDFNNILTGIIGNISIIKYNIEKDDKNYTIIDDVERASAKAKELTQQLLTFSKGGEPVKKIISIENILVDTANFVMSGSNINCEFNISSDLWNVNADAGQISQVIHNILINARQSMEQGGTITIDTKNHSNVKVENFNLENNDLIEIIISDQGDGISDEIINLIFDPYFTTKNQGSGLGLAVSYSIVEKHKGHIEVTSKINKGTEFKIYLPASKKELMVKKSYSNLKSEVKTKILIMDDDEIILSVLTKMLTFLGHFIEVSYHGEEALEKYKISQSQKEPFDIIIMDLTIPGKMGGKETIVKLLDINPDIKAVVSSGYSNDPIMANYKDYGFTSVLSKPFNIDEVKSVLGEILSS